MDSRLKLNKKQQALLKRLKETYEALIKENVGIIQNGTDLLFFNKKDVLSVLEGCPDGNEYRHRDEYWSVNPNDLDELLEEIDQPCEELVYHYPSDLPAIPIDADLYDYYYDGFSLLLPNGKEVDAFYLKEELEALDAELDRLNDSLQQYRDAIDNAQTTVEQLKQNNAPKEIIEEETASIAVNEQHISELKKEIAKQKRKIRDKKAKIEKLLQNQG